MSSKLDGRRTNTIDLPSNKVKLLEHLQSASTCQATVLVGLGWPVDSVTLAVVKLPVVRSDVRKSRLRSMLSC